MHLVGLQSAVLLRWCWLHRGSKM